MLKFISLFLLAAFSSNSVVRVNAPDLKGHAREELLLLLNVTIKEGYHIQANEVADDALIPTRVELQPYSGITAGQPVFPVAKKFRLEGTTDYLDVFDGKFDVVIPIKTADLGKGHHTLQGQFHYQACDNQTCFFPKTITFAVSLEII